MKIRAAVLVLTLALSSVASAAVVDPAEPPKTPAGGAPEAGLTTGQLVGGAILVGVIVAVAAGDDGDGVAAGTATSTGTGTGTGTQ